MWRTCLTTPRYPQGTRRWNREYLYAYYRDAPPDNEPPEPADTVLDPAVIGCGEVPVLASGGACVDSVSHGSGSPWSAASAASTSTPSRMPGRSHSGGRTEPWS